MKRQLLFILFAIGLLIGTAATVKASEPVVKPDTSKHSTGARIIPVGSGDWNYTNEALCAVAHIAIPTSTFTAVVFQDHNNTPQLNSDVYWLRFEGVVTATGKHIFVYFPLIKTIDWYEIDPTTVPPGWTGGPAGAASCSGECYWIQEESDGDINEWPSGDVCENVSRTWMVNCQCTGGGAPGRDQLGCEFKQGYPESIQILYQNLKAIHD